MAQAFQSLVLMPGIGCQPFHDFDGKLATFGLYRSRVKRSYTDGRVVGIGLEPKDQIFIFFYTGFGTGNTELITDFRFFLGKKLVIVEGLTAENRDRLVSTFAGFVLCKFHTRKSIDLEGSARLKLGLEDFVHNKSDSIGHGRFQGQFLRFIYPLERDLLGLTFPEFERHHFDVVLLALNRTKLNFFHLILFS